MKKILLSAVALLSLTAVTAQDKIAAGSVAVTDRVDIEITGDRASEDSLITTEFNTACNGASSYSLYTVANGGYVAGTNDYGDLAKGMQYNFGTTGGSAEVVGVLVWYGAKESVNGNSVFAASVYDQSQTMIGGLSATHTLADIDTTGGSGFVEYTFNTPVTVTTDTFYVFVSVDDLLGGTDTVGIVSTVDPCGTSSYEIWSDNSFEHLPTAWASSGGVPLNIDLGIWALVNNLGYTGIFDSENNSEFGVYTNANTLYLNGISEDATVNQVVIYDLAGKAVKTFNVADQFTNLSFDISDLSSGNYIVALNTNKGKAAQKINIAK